MAVELGTAYISILPDTKNLAAGIRTAMREVESSAVIKPTVDTKALHGPMSTAGRESSQSFLQAFKTYTDQGISPVAAGIGVAAGRSIGAGIHANKAVFHAAGQMIATTIKGAAVAGLAGVGAVIGATLFKGFERLESLDRTRHQLESLNKTLVATGKAGINVNQMIADVTKTVEGTPIALNEAFAEVPKLLAAGIKPGKDLTDMITAMGDAAGYTGQPFSELAIVFEQVMNKGKLMGEEVQQFAERGINLSAWLQDSLKVDPATLEKMMRDGKVGITQVMQAIEDHAGGMAKDMGETIQGAMANTMTAMARVGANLISAAFGGDTVTASDNIVNGIKAVGAQFDKLSAWVIAHRDEIHQFFLSMADFAKRAGEAIGGIAKFLLDHPGLVKTALAIWAGVEVITAIANIGKLVTAIGTMNTALAATKAVQVGGMATDMAALGTSAGAAGIGIGGFAAAALPVVGVLAAIATGLAAVGGSIWAWKSILDLRRDEIELDKLQARNIGPSAVSGPGAIPQIALPPTNPNAQSGRVPPGFANPMDVLGPGAGQPTSQTPGSVLAPGVNPFMPGGGESYRPPPSPAAVAGIAKAQQLSGLPYTPGTLDCSGYVSQVYSAMSGTPTHFTTTADFAALGFHRGYMPGALNIGVNPLPVMAGHMAATLPNGVPIESGGSSGGVSYNSGPGAQGKQFSQQWWYMPGYQSGGAIGDGNFNPNMQIDTSRSNKPLTLWEQLQAQIISNYKNVGEHGKINWPKSLRNFFKQSGGGIGGTGSGDTVPVLAEPGEHMLTRADVAAMGGQGAVYAWRQALHRDTGGWIPDPRDLKNLNIGNMPPGMMIDTSRATSTPGGKGRALMPSRMWDTLPPGEGQYIGTGDTGLNTGALVKQPLDRLQGWWYDKELWAKRARDTSWMLPGKQGGGEITDEIKAKADELGVTPEQFVSMMQAGATQHLPPGAKPGQPMPPGPAGQPAVQVGGQDKALDAQAGGQDKALAEAVARTAGLIPSGAGNVGSVAGTSFLAGILNMGNEAAAGAIDIGAQVAQAAISAAGEAGSFGAGGGAAGALAGPAIQLGATQLKRTVSYGFQLAAIGADSLLENLFSPFGGAPRWIGYDYTTFVPHSMLGQLGGFATTTLEKAIQQGINPQQQQPGQTPGGPVQPGQLPGAQIAGPPVPKFGQPPAPMPPPAGPPGADMQTPTGPPPGPAPGAPPELPGGKAGLDAKTPQLPPREHSNTNEPFNPLNWFGFDQGGWWQPGQVGINQTRRPEAVISPAQLDALAGAPQQQGNFGVHIEHLYAADARDVADQIAAQQRLAMMRYAGRP